MSRVLSTNVDPASEEFARNEAAHIEQTILSVIKQSVRPIKWIIVSDGSTDGTNDIVAKYGSSHPWIEGVYLPERKERHFAAKVHALSMLAIRTRPSATARVRMA